MSCTQIGKNIWKNDTPTLKNPFKESKDTLFTARVNIKIDKKVPVFFNGCEVGYAINGNESDGKMVADIIVTDLDIAQKLKNGASISATFKPTLELEEK